jgi:serine/threonine protein kinase
MGAKEEKQAPQQQQQQQTCSCDTVSTLCDHDTVGEVLAARICQVDMDIRDVIGSSDNLRVYAGMMDRRTVAVKILHLPSLYELKPHSAAGHHMNALRELFVRFYSRRLRAHPNVCEILAVHNDEQWIIAVMEYATRGDLRHYAFRRGARPFSLAQAHHIFCSVLRAVQLAHASGVVHRDIKPENILLTTESVTPDENGRLPLRVMLADWGLCTDRLNFSAGAGTPGYAAPELFTDLRTSRLPRCEKADIWSLGVVLYMLVCDSHPSGYGALSSNSAVGETHQVCVQPFIRKEQQQQRQQQRNNEPVPSAVVLLIQNMLMKHPNMRPSAHTLLQHNWTANGDSEYLY